MKWTQIFKQNNWKQALNFIWEFEPRVYCHWEFPSYTEAQDGKSRKIENIQVLWVDQNNWIDFCENVSYKIWGRGNVDHYPTVFYFIYEDNDILYKQNYWDGYLDFIDQSIDDPNTLAKVRRRINAKRSRSQMCIEFVVAEKTK